MMKTLMTMALAAVTFFGATVMTIEDAEARRGRNIGIAAGIIGLGILGAAAAANARDRHYERSGGCYPGPERCSWKNRHCFENRYGDYVCRGGRYTCHRPTICD